MYGFNDKKSKNIESWTDYDPTGQWVLKIKKKRGRLTIDEIIEECKRCDHDFYMLVLKAMDEDVSQYYMMDDLDGDFVTCYRADDFFRWRDKDEKGSDLMPDMTSTEAVFHPKQILSDWDNPGTSKSVTESLKYAIKKLEDKSKWVDQTLLDMKCLKCGARSVVDTPYCPYCGREIEK